MLINTAQFRVVASTLADEVIRLQAATGHVTLIPDPELMTSPHWKGVLSRTSKWTQRVFILSVHVKERAVVLEQVDAHMHGTV